MSKHTPGKWRVKAELNVENENYDFVATCGCNGRDPEINKANTQLISAAPDLLEACKDALKEIDLHSDHPYCQLGISKDNLVNKIEQAITKAEESK